MILLTRKLCFIDIEINIKLSDNGLNDELVSSSVSSLVPNI
jgi:hypothetical protein